MTDLQGFAMVIVHTPTWVWLLYAALLIVGLLRTRDSSLPLARVLVLPLGVTGLTISSFIGAGVAALPVMFLALALGGLVGLRFEHAGSVRRIEDGRLWLRGEWWTFAQIAIVLVLRYLTNIVAVTDPVLNANPAWHISTLASLSALAGLFLGRTAARLKVFFAAERTTRVALPSWRAAGD